MGKGNPRFFLSFFQEGVHINLNIFGIDRNVNKIHWNHPRFSSLLSLPVIPNLKAPRRRGMNWSMSPKLHPSNIRTYFTIGLQSTYVWAPFAVGFRVSGFPRPFWSRLSRPLKVSRWSVPKHCHGRCKTDLEILCCRTSFTRMWHQHIRKWLT